MKQKAYGKYENVLLDDTELEALKEKFTNWPKLIERVSVYKEKEQKRYVSDYAAVVMFGRCR